ncbi:Hypothetical predicted protein [Olea europaea subsp. europaea]|uniref:Uncharacterized protein n=1 Tax=Olea europaea subsp. europaea TaxID=158383 RepID=A0A8S0QSE3_OLEEU|nr:Hypothetical predicted protein [Olea europaea subsp. europaea]
MSRMMDRLDLMMRKMDGQERERKEKGMAENSPESAISEILPSPLPKEEIRGGVESREDERMKIIGKWASRIHPTAYLHSRDENPRLNLCHHRTTIYYHGEGDVAV